MNKPIAYILVGVPAAGKSTYVACHIDPDVYTIASSDKHIEKWAAGAGKTYSEVFSRVVKDAQRFFDLELFQAVENKKPVVVDRTNMSVKSRKKVIDVLKNTHELHAIVFPTPDDEEHQRRLDNRPGKFIPPNVIEMMKNNFEMPTTEEGFASVVVKS